MLLKIVPSLHSEFCKGKAKVAFVGAGAGNSSVLLLPPPQLINKLIKKDDIYILIFHYFLMILNDLLSLFLITFKM